MHFADTSDATIFFAVVLARLVIPLFIPRFPLPAILGALLVDGVDRDIFGTFTHLDPGPYQAYDKALDIYYLSIAYASTIRNWGGGFAFALARGLWYYRLIGVVLFEHFQARWLLFLFPNTFEYFFIAIEWIKVTRNPFVLPRRHLATLAAFIWIFIKLPQEWWIHVGRLDATDVMKQYLFGAARTVTWPEAIRHRPYALALLPIAAAALFALSHIASRRLPPREWKATLSADTQGTYLGWPRPSRRTLPYAFFGWPFVEKAVLVTLVTVIFVQILPGMGTNFLQIGVAVTAIIAATTLISQWLARRAFTWRSTAVQFLAMFATNIGLGVAAIRLVPGERTRPPAADFLFLVGLLTLIVTLFDRSRLVGRHIDPERWTDTTRGTG